MNTFILIFFNAAALRVVADKAAMEAKDVIVTPEQIVRYAGFLGDNAYSIGNRVVMKVKCVELPRPYYEVAEAIFISEGVKLKLFKSRTASQNLWDIAREADLERYYAMTLGSAEPKPELHTHAEIQRDQK
jgi:hypothetical protein